MDKIREDILAIKRVMTSSTGNIRSPEKVLGDLEFRELYRNLSNVVRNNIKEVFSQIQRGEQIDIICASLNRKESIMAKRNKEKKNKNKVENIDTVEAVVVNIDDDDDDEKNQQFYIPGPESIGYYYGIEDDEEESEKNRKDKEMSKANNIDIDVMEEKKREEEKRSSAKKHEPKEATKKHEPKEATKKHEPKEATKKHEPKEAEAKKDTGSDIPETEQTSMLLGMHPDYEKMSEEEKAVRRIWIDVYDSDEDVPESRLMAWSVLRDLGDNKSENRDEIITAKAKDEQELIDEFIKDNIPECDRDSKLLGLHPEYAQMSNFEKELRRTMSAIATSESDLDPCDLELFSAARRVLSINEYNKIHGIAKSDNKAV